MSVITGQSQISLTPRGVCPPAVYPTLYRFTVAQYDRMVRDGTIGINERIELVDGLLLRKMGKNPPHVFTGKLALKLFAQIVAPDWHVAKEDPVVVSAWSKPEPDLSVVRGTERDYATRAITAADVALVAEIADASLASDRSEMANLYAQARIPVYWIINLVDRQVEVFSEPDSGGYRSRVDFAPGQDVPVVIDGIEVGRIAVSDIIAWP